MIFLKKFQLTFPFSLPRKEGGQIIYTQSVHLLFGHLILIPGVVFYTTPDLSIATSGGPTIQSFFGHAIFPWMTHTPTAITLLPDVVQLLSENFIICYPRLLGPKLNFGKQVMPIWVALSPQIFKRSVLSFVIIWDIIEFLFDVIKLRLLLEEFNDLRSSHKLILHYTHI